MSAQQCLRRLPGAVRSAAALRVGARAAIRVPGARSYAAVSKATSSGLLRQASRLVLPHWALTVYANSPVDDLDS